MKLVWAAIAAIPIVLAIPVLSDPVVDPHLSLAQDRWETAPDGRRFLMGNITNTHISKACDCTLGVNYFDSAHVQIVHKTARMENLQPGARWDFKVAAFNPKIANYEITDVKARWYGGADQLQKTKKKAQDPWAGTKF